MSRIERKSTDLATIADGIEVDSSHSHTHFITLQPLSRDNIYVGTRAQQESILLEDWSEYDAPSVTLLSLRVISFDQGNTTYFNLIKGEIRIINLHTYIDLIISV